MDPWWAATLIVIAAAFLSAAIIRIINRRQLRRMARMERKMFNRPVDDRLWWEPH